jgi:hypothetical protein
VIAPFRLAARRQGVAEASAMSPTLGAKPALAALAVAALWPVVAQAQAQGDPAVASAAPPAASGALAFRLATALDLQERGLILTAAPQVTVAWGAGRPFFVELHAAAVWQTDDGFESRVARPGNPWLLVGHRRRLDRGGWAIALGLAAPVASVTRGPDGRAQRSAYAHALGTWGLWNAWLWSPGRMAITLPVRAFVHLPFAEIRSEAAVAVLPAIGGDEQGSAWVGQAAGELCRASEGPRLCARLSAVTLPTASLDKLQVAVGARIEPFHDRRLFALLLVNVDAPLGFGRGQRLWGLHLGKELGP